MNSLKQSFTVFLGKNATYIFSFLVSIIVARLLGPEGRGIYSSIILVPAIFITLGELGITQAIVYYHGRKLIERQKLFSSVLLFIFIASIVLSLICLVIYDTYYHNDFKFLWEIIAILQIPISLFIRTSGGFFLGEGKIGLYNKISWIPSALNVIFTFLFIYVFDLNIIGALSAIILSQIYTFTYGVKKLSVDYTFTFSNTSYDVLKTLLKTGIVYALSLFIIQANYRIDIFILKSLVSYEEIGYYSIGVSISEILWQIPYALGIVILSKTATSYSDSQKFIIAKALRLSWVVMILAIGLMYMLMPYFIQLVYGKAFLKSISVNRILLVGVFVFSIFKIVNSRFAGLGKPYIAIFIFIPCLIIKVLGNFVLVPEYGIEGAAWASNFSYIIAGIAMLLAFSKVEKISVKEILTYQKSDFKEIKQLVKKYALLRKF